ncbi:glycosyltransferase family 4 protein, partial [Candidatus Woesearchaeota archaeon]|nr:glycosyltransferase family 4 protein [Candidatus Woesearchaeota archaeon]
MKILMLCYEYPPIGGGAAIYVKLISEQLVRKGHQVNVITMHYSDLPYYENQGGIGVYRVPCLRKKVEVCHTHEMLTYCWSAFWKSRQLLKKAKKQGKPYDVNHTHFIIPTGLVSYFLRIFCGLPYVVTTHGSDVPGYNPDRFKLQHKLIAPFFRILAKAPSSIICLTHAIEQLLKKTDKKLPVVIIPNAVTPGYFKQKKKQKKILLSSRLLPRKGFQFFLEAISGMDLKGYEVNITGDGPYKKELEDQLKRLKKEGKIKGTVKILGWIDKKDLNSLYETSSIFVFPSLMDNFSMALLDAMNAGMAIIAADAAGNPEVVGDAAILVPPGKPDPIRKALEKLIKD